jgi:hypothetical protein
MRICGEAQVVLEWHIANGGTANGDIVFVSSEIH